MRNIAISTVGIGFGIRMKYKYIVYRYNSNIADDTGSARLKIMRSGKNYRRKTSDMMFCFQDKGIEIDLDGVDP